MDARGNIPVSYTAGFTGIRTLTQDTTVANTKQIWLQGVQANGVVDTTPGTFLAGTYFSDNGSTWDANVVVFNASPAITNFQYTVFYYTK
jgi:hypothetical protein